MSATHRVTVVARDELTRRTVRLTLAGPSLVGLPTRPAQDIEVLLPDESGARVKRRYTIRHARPDRGEIDVDVVVHGIGGPGSRWAAQARLGSAAEFVGPRGKLELRPAPWHLFVGDEASLPAIAALTESLPPDEVSLAVVQVESDADRQALAATHQRWLIRDGHPADSAGPLIEAVDALALPPTPGHAYLLGESRAVRDLRDYLESRGIPRGRIFAKGYWNAEQAPRETARMRRG